MLDEQLSVKWLTSFVSSVRDQMCVNKIRVLDGDVPIMLVKSGLVSGGFVLA